MFAPPNWEERTLKWPPKYLWTLLRLSWEMFFSPPDLLFIPAHGLPLVLPKRTVATIHDIGFERFPELYRRRALWYHRFVVRRALKRSSAIITISEWTKKELASCFKNIKIPIVVIPLAHDERRYHSHISLSDQQEAQKRYNIKPPYFFFIGRLEKKKNIGRLIKAFVFFLDRASAPSTFDKNYHTIEYDSFGRIDRNGEAPRLYPPEADGLHRDWGAKPRTARLGRTGALGKKSNDEWSFVLVGPRGYGFAEANTLIKKYKLDDRVKILNWVPESDIPALMAGAAALVFPSLYEGFGIPILEAMATGTPVITSDRGAMAEVAGSAALLVNPRDVAAISHAMRTISTDESLASSLRTAGLARASGFSWQSTAQATWQVFHSALT